jgi:hypothetical protein
MMKSLTGRAYRNSLVSYSNSFEKRRSLRIDCVRGKGKKRRRRRRKVNLWPKIYRASGTYLY